MLWVNWISFFSGQSITSTNLLKATPNVSRMAIKLMCGGCSIIEEKGYYKIHSEEMEALTKRSWKLFIVNLYLQRKCSCCLADNWIICGVKLNCLKMYYLPYPWISPDVSHKSDNTKIDQRSLEARPTPIINKNCFGITLLRNIVR